MKKQLAIGVALALVCVPAIAESGFYAGAGAGQVKLEDDIAGVNIEASGTGFRIFGGYQINDYFSVEAAYNKGEADDTVLGVKIDSDSSAIQASALLRNPMGTHFEAYVRGSILAWEAEHSATYGGTRARLSTDGTDLGYGIGIGCRVSPKFAIRAEYEGAELDGTDLRLFSLSGLLTF